MKQQTLFKLCTGCKRELPTSEFFAHCRTSDRLQPQCKQCARDRLKRRYAIKAEDIKAYVAEWGRRNKDKRQVWQKRWRDANRMRQNETGSIWRKKNRAKCRQYCAKRYARKRQATLGDLAEIQRVYDTAASTESVNCFYCKALIPKGERHVDHKVPLSRGGAHAAINLCVCCASCNLSKGAKTDEEFIQPI